MRHDLKIWSDALSSFFGVDPALRAICNTVGKEVEQWSYEQLDKSTEEISFSRKLASRALLRLLETPGRLGILLRVAGHKYCHHRCLRARHWCRPRLLNFRVCHHRAG